MACYEPIFRYRLLTLNPSGDRHGILLDELSADLVLAANLLQELPCLLEHILRHKPLTVLLRLLQEVADLRHILCIEFRRIIHLLVEAWRRLPFQDIVGKGLPLRPRTYPGTASCGSILGHFQPSFSRRGSIPRLNRKFCA